MGCARTRRVEDGGRRWGDRVYFGRMSPARFRLVPRAPRRALDTFAFAPAATGGPISGVGRRPDFASVLRTAAAGAAVVVAGVGGVTGAGAESLDTTGSGAPVAFGTPGSGAAVASTTLPSSSPGSRELALLGLASAHADAEVHEVDGDRVGWFDANGDGRRDQGGDIYFHDHGADGSCDRVVRWFDADGDGRAELQLLVSLTDGVLGPGLTAFVVADRSGAAEFWATERGEYVQSWSQFRSDFHGDGWFAALRWDQRTAAWTAFDESFFGFFDPDGDGRSEEALRVGGLGLMVHDLRWSFDTDDDARGPIAGDGAAGAVGVGVATVARAEVDSVSIERYADAYDYDLSLTGILRSRVMGAFIDTLALPAGPLPVLTWDDAREWAGRQNWGRVVLTADENDRNVDPDDPAARERWEGVIASPPDGFPPVGNPACGTVGKRYEIRNGMPGPPELYVHPLDGRVHLRHAARGWLEIDGDDDGRADSLLETADRDGDGYVDTWLWDGDGDGSFEHAYRSPRGIAVEPVALEFATLRAAEAAVAERTGLLQGDRYRAEVAAWKRAGRFVPIDSLDTVRSAP